VNLIGTRRSIALLVLLVTLGGVTAQSFSAARSSRPVVDAQGNLRVPDDYQTRYQSLGAWSIATAPGTGVGQMHLVYASPASIEQFRRLGHFPDGTVLVKEVWAASTKSMATGTVSRPDQLKGWFVMMKASRNLHPENKLWGDGWAWSWFDADNRTKTTSTDYTKDCKGCHVPAQMTDWIYSDGYAALRRR
jgi:hypothetical protein